MKPRSQTWPSSNLLTGRAKVFVDVKRLPLLHNPLPLEDSCLKKYTSTQKQ
jgi:hypothetical protein